jgi:5-methylcytosine-specific restriction endonuclease McrA
MIERKCLFCDAVFFVQYASDKQKYCTHACAMATRKTRVARTCEYCGKSFAVSPSKLKEGKGRFCSKACYEEDRKLPPRTCQICGATFYPDRHRVAKGGGKFCSDACKRLGSRTRVERTCPSCGKTFLAPPSRIKFAGAKYCSIECRGNGARVERVTCRCEICGKEFERTRNQVEKHKRGRFCSRACFYKWRAEYQVGENAPLWYGGTSFEPYPIEFNDIFKRKIRARDSHTCAICGKAGKCVHHIDYDKENTVPENCITLCRICHGSTVSHRSFWTKVLSNYLRTEQHALADSG